MSVANMSSNFEEGETRFLKRKKVGSWVEGRDSGRENEEERDECFSTFFKVNFTKNLFRDQPKHCHWFCLDPALYGHDATSTNS